MTGSALLAAHLSENKHTLRAFAKSVGASASLVCMWLSGDRTPGLALAVAVEGATKGAVPLTSWLPREKPKRRPTKKTRRRSQHIRA